ncbi:ABC transporter permease [Streptomyces sp. A3M-1-3]|uniref:ABC transporter permease n=1 Tax=Streptomyces sp. A3M-1-3 TaxID=2962044 RepID=UPI0020B873D6|nr:ABC transporter permease [Streptomyces sp. A3M-1-3]MCP3817903.1 ABC transporter permease [Streptomyces sp. A3M-1-3]
MTTLAQPVAEPRARLRDLLAAEWIKLWSLRSTPWSFVISALAVIAFNAGAAYDHYRYWPQFGAVHQAEFIRNGLALWDAFTGNAGMVLMLCAGAIGALTVVSEYSTGMIRTTFAAVPARRSVMAAKVVVVTAVTTVFGAVVAAVSFGLTQAILSGRDAGLSISHPGALRLVVASALLAPLSALVGMAVGAVIRHSATTMVAHVVILLLLPMAFSDDRHWSAVIAHTLPYQAWTRLTQFGDHQAAYPWTITGAWIVYAVWALAAAVLAVTSVHRRDQ